MAETEAQGFVEFLIDEAIETLGKDATAQRVVEMVASNYEGNLSREVVAVQARAIVLMRIADGTFTP